MGPPREVHPTIICILSGRYTTELPLALRVIRKQYNYTDTDILNKKMCLIYNYLSSDDIYFKDIGSEM